MNDNILRVSFGGVRTIVANPLWQYDYGQTLLIKGLNLPDLYEVHDNINKGQQKQIVKREEIKKLFERYGVEY